MASSESGDDFKEDFIVPINSEDAPEKSGKLVAIINALNMIAGCSFLGLPFAFKQAGWAGGLMTVTFCGCLTGKRQSL